MINSHQDTPHTLIPIYYFHMSSVITTNDIEGNKGKKIGRSDDEILNQYFSKFQCIQIIHFIYLSRFLAGKGVIQSR